MKGTFTALALLAGTSILALAQTQPATTPPPYNAGGLPRTPTYNTVEGQPIDSRAPERKADSRQFPQQTRAPFHHATDFTVTPLTSGLQAAWASALLPSGKILITERLPGAFRLLDKGKLSAPQAGLDGLHVSTPMTKQQEKETEPEKAANHTIYFTYFEYHD